MRSERGDQLLERQLRRAVLLVAGLNLAYFFLEVTVAVAIGSVSLLADSVDFLEDTTINLLIFWALGWTVHRQAVAGKAMAVILLVPALAAGWQAVTKIGDPDPPDPLALMLTAGGAAAVNLTCSLVLARFRRHGSSTATAAFLSARNDVVINLAIVAMGGLTAWTSSGWPDLLLGVIIVILNAGAAKEVWETAEEEGLTARALAGA